MSEQNMNGMKMKKLFATAAIILATATSALAGNFYEEMNTDPVNGRKRFTAGVGGVIENPSWYNDNTAAYVISCRNVSPARPNPNDIGILLNLGDEVLDTRVSGYVSVEYNVNGMFVGGDSVKSLSTGMVNITPQLRVDRKGYLVFSNKDGAAAHMYAKRNGTFIVRLDRFDAPDVVVRITYKDFDLAFKKAANACGFAVREGA